jgi:hypothetical protein
MIPHDCIVILNIVSAVAWLVAALLLYWASLSLPWELRSWSGRSAGEKQWGLRRRIMACVGIPCVVIGAGCQIAIALLG